MGEFIPLGIGGACVEELAFDPGLGDHVTLCGKIDGNSGAGTGGFQKRVYQSLIYPQLISAAVPGAAGGTELQMVMVQKGPGQVDGGCSSVGQKLWVREGKGRRRTNQVALVCVLLGNKPSKKEAEPDLATLLDRTRRH